MFSTYLRRINGNYFFRIRIPNDLLHIVGFSEYQRSLKTQNPSLAKKQARHLAAKAEEIFSLIRLGLISEKQMVQVLQDNFPRRSNKPDVTCTTKKLSELIDVYVDEHITIGKWSDKTALEARSLLAMLTRIIGDHQVSDVSREMIVRYAETLSSLPPGINMKKEYRSKSIEEILALDTKQKMSVTSVNKYLDRARFFFLWCVRHGQIERSPVIGLTINNDIKPDEERSAYSFNDLSKIRHTLVEYKIVAPERYYVPLIAAFSGARLNEICQLYVGDIKEIDGVWCFDINDDGDKRLKNKASRRVIPVHPELVRLGLLDHVEKMTVAGCPRLWMNLVLKRDGYSHDFGKWYQRLNRKHITHDPKKVFHSFRHLVADTLKQKGVAEGVIAEILGHANQSITTGRYGKRYRPAVLLDALTKLDY